MASSQGTHAGHAAAESENLSANQVRGYKSVLARDNVFDQAKTHARQVLEHNEGRLGDGDEEHSNRVLGGYKAALKNPNVSVEAKAHAQEILDSNDSGVMDA